MPPTLFRLLPQRTIPRALSPLPFHLRPYSSSSSSSSTFQPGPSPPRLPAEQQAEFERLQRAVAKRIADPTPLPHEQQQQPQSQSQPVTSSPPSPSPASTSRHISTPSAATAAAAAAAAAATTTPAKDEEELQLPTSVRRGAKPEFEGDTNPKTGEVGGPKNEPLRWGSGGDWSYNGRVTDF